MTLLRAEHLNKSFGSVVAANDITVAIEENELIGVIGANGAGKTTFVNMVTGYLKPDSGRILYNERDITSLPPRDITRIGICRSFQVPQVFLTSTVYDNLLISLGVADEGLMRLLMPMRRRDLEEKAEALLAQYQLTDYRDHTADLLPQGVRKLMDIAMALAHGPRLLLLDEPTSGVSADEKFVIMDTIIEALQTTNVTTLFVEHDMEIIERYCSRVLAFYDGGIIADGPPDQVLQEDHVRQYVIGEELHRKGAKEGGDA